MFDSLRDRLQGVFRSLRGEARLTEETVEAALREIRMALLEADVNFKVAKAFIDKVRDKAVDQEFVADYVVSSAVGMPFSAEVTRRLTAVEGVEEVAAFRWDNVTVEGERDTVIGIDPQHVRVLGPTPMVSGRLDALTPTSVSVSQERATASGLRVGSRVEMTRYGTTKPFTVAAVHGESALLKSVRPYLLGERGVARADVSVSAYWRRGTTEEGFRVWKSQQTDAVMRPGTP